MESELITEKSIVVPITPLVIDDPGFDPEVARECAAAMRRMIEGRTYAILNKPQFSQFIEKRS